MEKDLKDKKQEEKNTPKIPWTKLVPAAAVIAALVFSGIKAKGSDGETEAVGQAETTVMSASELEKYLGYEKENTVSDSTTATAEKNSTTKKKSSSKKSAKKTAAKKSSGTRTVSESAKSNASAAGQGTTQTPVASVPADGYKDGTYEGSGTGFGGTIRVRVTISGGKIAAIDILEASGETASYFASAQGVISRMIAGNTPNVDAVSGATYSSNGIIQAVQNALSQAAADGNSQQVTPTPAATALPTPTSAPSPTKKPSKKPSPTKEPEDPDSPKKYLDGKYTASAKGFNGDVKVIVTIKDGVIEALKQENTDTEQFFEKAWSVLEEQIIGTDSVDDIDAVSGATYSSNGILNAVKKALKEAINPEYGKKPTPTPTKKPTPKPTATPKPMATPKPTATPKPIETPAATPTPEPDDPDVTPVPEKPNVTPTPGTDEPDATPEPTEAPEPVGMYRDGTYTGSAFGYGGKTYLTITISGGQIVSIEQTNQDTPEFFDPAWSTIYSQIMANQSADGIDTVSGATYSSEGILDAAQKALAQAKN